MPRDDAIGAALPGGAGQPVDRAARVRLVADTLKGPVAKVFRDLIPAFKAFTGEQFYSIAMSNGTILHGCLLIFRHRRNSFAHLLVDARGRVVRDDFVRLSCGKTVHEVITLIVRTHAKRQFRASLGGDPNDFASEAGQMYQAIKEYLIHEWQVPLVPHYSALPVDMVLDMGPELLDIREPKKLDAIAAAAAPPAKPKAVAVPTPPAAAPPPPSPPAPAAAPVAVVVEPPPAPRAPAPAKAVAWNKDAAPADLSDQQEFWWEVLRDVQLAAVLGRLDEWEKREFVTALASCNEATHQEIFGGLMLSMPQAAACMIAAYRTLGERSFKLVFGSPGRPQTVAIVAQRMRTRNLGSRTELRALYKAMDGLVKV